MNAMNPLSIRTPRSTEVRPVLSLSWEQRVKRAARTACNRVVQSSKAPRAMLNAR